MPLLLIIIVLVAFFLICGSLQDSEKHSNPKKDMETYKKYKDALEEAQTSNASSAVVDFLEREVNRTMPDEIKRKKEFQNASENICNKMLNQPPMTDEEIMKLIIDENPKLPNEKDTAYISRLFDIKLQLLVYNKRIKSYRINKTDYYYAISEDN